MSISCCCFRTWYSSLKESVLLALRVSVLLLSRALPQSEMMAESEVKTDAWAWIDRASKEGEDVGRIAATELETVVRSKSRRAAAMALSGTP